MEFCEFPFNLLSQMPHCRDMVDHCGWCKVSSERMEVVDMSKNRSSYSQVNQVDRKLSLILGRS